MCIVLGILILALLAYIVYLYASYYRIEDNQELVVEAPVDDTTTGAAAVLATDTEYSALTYNIGFELICRITASSWTAVPPPGRRARRPYSMP